jgi:hypothetical protein
MNALHVLFILDHSYHKSSLTTFVLLMLLRCATPIPRRLVDTVWLPASVAGNGKSRWCRASVSWEHRGLEERSSYKVHF